MQQSKEEVAETGKQLVEVHKDKKKTKDNLDNLNKDEKKLQVEILKALLEVVNKGVKVKEIERQKKWNEDKISQTCKD